MILLEKTRKSIIEVSQMYHFIQSYSEIQKCLCFQPKRWSHREHALVTHRTSRGHRQNKPWAAIAHISGTECPKLIFILGNIFLTL